MDCQEYFVDLEMSLIGVATALEVSAPGKLSYLAGMSPYISLKIKKRHYEHHMIEAHK